MKRIGVPERAAEAADPAFMLQGTELIQIAIGAVVVIGLLFWLWRSLRAEYAVTEESGE